MPETNKDIAVALYKKALFEGQVEEAFGFTRAQPIASTIRSSKTGWKA
jgi:hypothetical protein